MHTHEKGEKSYILVMLHETTWCQVYFLVPIFLEIQQPNYMPNYQIKTFRFGMLLGTTSITGEKRIQSDDSDEY
jgi:hypothetical protein